MTPTEQVLESVAWEVLPPCVGDLPYATHKGVLKLGGHELRCYRLNDGRAIFDADDINAFFASALAA